ncbi:tyrosine-type recombinase/integrase [Vibrio vulnificus]|nr:tyrosine-type recombinase/integrase [Vibrio vulnificus]
MVKKSLSQTLLNTFLYPEKKNVSQEWGCVADLLLWYQERIEKDAHRSRERKATIKSAIKCHLIPSLGELSLSDVSRQIIDDALIWPLQETRSLATVKSVLSVLKQAFKQAEKLGRLESNPLAGIVFSDFVSVPIKEKDGRLFATDIENVFTQLMDCDRVTQCLVLMLLGHGTRIRETLAAKWAHIDLVDGYWRLPMSDTKTDEWHTLPLTEAMRLFLESYRRWQAKRGYRGVFLFPGHGHAKPLSYSTSRKLLNQVSEGNWSAHDCRKALKTICTDALNVDDAVSERILNHTMDRTRKAYNKALYEGPMRDALTRYHDWLGRRGLNEFLETAISRSARSFSRNQLSDCAA